jgi:amino acid adenylation domain-containing protein
MQHLLSYYQQQVWRRQSLDPAGVLHNLSRCARISGFLYVEALRQAIDVIVARHAPLRTHFEVVEGDPAQVIDDDLKESLRVIDLSDIRHSDPDALFEQLLLQNSQRPFDLAISVPLRIMLVRLGPGQHALILTMHQLICDDSSADIFCREMTALYTAFSTGLQSALNELQVQYIDHVQWLRGLLEGEKLERQVSYWDRQLKRPLSSVQLPIRRSRGLDPCARRASDDSMLSAALLDDLKALGKSEEATLFMVLLAGFKLLLHRYTGEEDILASSQIEGRNQPGKEGSIGLFENIIYLRTDLAGDPGFLELLRRIRQGTLDAYEHRDFPCESLINTGNTGDQLRPMMFNLRKAPRVNIEFVGLETHPVEVESNAAMCDLRIEAVETPEGLIASCSYNRELFDPDAISRLMRHYGVLLRDAANNPHRPIRQMSLLTDAERHQLEIEWNDTCEELPAGICIHELIEEQAARTPDAVALTCENSHLTYRELDERANQVGRYLQRLDSRAEVRVGVFSDRTLEMVIGLLGILKAGGTYLPLDPAYPAERLSFMVDDAQATVILAQTSLFGNLPENGARVVGMDAGWTACEGESREKCVANACSDNAAYLIYTSGSTGSPKGVTIEHRSAVVLSQWARSLFGANDLAAVLASTSICFDLSVFELFFPLSWGGKVILVENALSASQLCADQQVSLINTGPSIMAGMLRTARLTASVKTVNLAGEALKSDLVQQIYAQGSVSRVFNLYGPSEDTTYSTFALIKNDAEGAPAIGRPLTNSQVYLLDWSQQPVPLGVPGELYIGGEGLARAYLDRPDNTAERFVPDPFGKRPGARLYRTGDLSRHLPEGDIEFLGRIDHQVKVHGLRIELGEIEVVLAGHQGVREAVVVARLDDSGESRLIAYVVAARTPAPNETELSRYLIDKLPYYMVPSAFITMNSLPMTPNGKVDRKALPAVEVRGDFADEFFVAPRTPLEESLAKLWSELLGRTRVGVSDNFFRLGGHSLLGARFISRVRDEWNVNLYLDALFRAPTIGDMAVLITKRRAEQALTDDISAVLAELEDLSDERAQQLLDEMQQQSD